MLPRFLSVLFYLVFGDATVKAPMGSMLNFLIFIFLVALHIGAMSFFALDKFALVLAPAGVDRVLLSTHSWD